MMDFHDFRGYSDEVTRLALRDTFWFTLFLIAFIGFMAAIQ